MSYMVRVIVMLEVFRTCERPTGPPRENQGAWSGVGDDLGFATRNIFRSLLAGKKEPVNTPESGEV